MFRACELSGEMPKQRTKEKASLSTLALVAIYFALDMVAAQEYLIAAISFVAGFAALVVVWKFQDMEVPVTGEQLKNILRESGENLDEFITQNTDESRRDDAAITPEEARERFDTSDYETFRDDCAKNSDLGGVECSQLWKAVEDLPSDTAS